MFALVRTESSEKLLQGSSGRSTYSNLVDTEKYVLLYLFNGTLCRNDYDLKVKWLIALK